MAARGQGRRRQAKAVIALVFLRPRSSPDGCSDVHDLRVSLQVPIWGSEASQRDNATPRAVHPRPQDSDQTHTSSRPRHTSIFSCRCTSLTLVLPLQWAKVFPRCGMDASRVALEIVGRTLKTLSQNLLGTLGSIAENRAIISDFIFCMYRR